MTTPQPEGWETFEAPPGAEATRINFLEPGAGPWFIASFPGRCATCGGDIDSGDEIRADGSGRYEGRCCDEDDQAEL